MASEELIQEKILAKSPQFILEETQSPIKTPLAKEGYLLKLSVENKDTPTRLIKLIHNDTKQLIAMAEVSAAEDSLFQIITKLAKHELRNTLFIHSLWIEPTITMDETLPALLYFAVRRGRIMARQNVVALVPNTGHAVARLLHLNPLERIKRLQYKDQTYLALAQRLDYAIAKVYEKTNGLLRQVINDNMVNEILENHGVWCERFFKGTWARSVYQGTMTKEQYIWFLFNLHQYVRQTTRLAARCVAHSENMELRNHYIYHLKGEVNHELLIERDLERLGADLDFLKNFHVPHGATKEFMVVQESTIGFYQDALLMLACPLAAEGFAAYLEKKPDFIEALYKNIESWGINPGKDAALFLSSHIKTDGGDDGHLQHVVDTMKKLIADEHRLQQFLSVYIAARNGFERGMNCIIEDTKLWA